MKELPAWALRVATSGDRLATKHALERGMMQTNGDTRNGLKEWAKSQGWPTPWFGFQCAFFKTMLENDEYFALVLTESGLEITIPKQEYFFPDEELIELNESYENGDWGWLVSRLREIRRAVEANVVVHIDGKKLKSWGGFYNWAHGRYHALEDGYDSWIGDDRS